MNRKDLPAPNATCEVCGRHYYRCKKCNEMRNRGIETWRAHCDSIECYQTLLIANTEDITKISKEEYEHVLAFELPDDRKPIPEIQAKLDMIGKQFDEKIKTESETTEEIKDGDAKPDDAKPKKTKQRNRAIEYIAKNVK